MQYGNQYTYIDDAELVPLASAGRPSLGPAVPWPLSTCPSVHRSTCPMALLSSACSSIPRARHPLLLALSQTTCPFGHPSLGTPAHSPSCTFVSFFFYFFDPTASFVYSYPCSSAFGQCVLSYSAPASLGAFAPCCPPFVRFTSRFPPRYYILKYVNQYWYFFIHPFLTIRGKQSISKRFRG